MEIKSTRYKNAIVYRFDNGTIEITRIDDSFLITTKKLVILKNKKEIKEYKKFDSKTSELIYRKHSKYGIWFNRIMFSYEAICCLSHSIKALKELK